MSRRRRRPRAEDAVSGAVVSFQCKAGAVCSGMAYFAGDAAVICGTMRIMRVIQAQPGGRIPEMWEVAPVATGIGRHGGTAPGGLRRGWSAQVTPARPPEVNPFDFLYAPGSKWLVLWMGLSPFVLALLIIWTRRRFRRK